MDWTYLISFIFFYIIGVCLHELGHKVFCDLLGVKVFQVKYFNFRPGEDGAEGWVIHEKPKRLHQSFFITMGPMFTNGLILSLFIIVIRLFELPIIFSIVFGVIGGLTASLFPSKPDIDNFLEHLRHEVTNPLLRGIGVLFGYVLLLFTIELVTILIAVIVAIGLMNFAPSIVDDMDRGYKVQKDCLTDCIAEYGDSKGFYKDNAAKEIDIEVKEVNGRQYICTCHNSDRTDGFQLEYAYT